MRCAPFLNNLAACLPVRLTSALCLFLFTLQLQVALVTSAPSRVSVFADLNDVQEPSSTVSYISASSFSDDNVDKTVKQAVNVSAHSWEYGATIQALLEVYNPELTVFSIQAFPSQSIPRVPNAGRSIAALSYAKPHIRTNDSSLADGAGAVGDPASLGIAALMLGAAVNGDKAYTLAAQRQLQTVLRAPRFYNGAISQRQNVAEFWADAVFMFPPFMAYYAVATNNQTLLRQAVQQCGAYRNALRANTTQNWSGLWTHIVGPQSQTLGIWATGNGWAALGMVRVLATVQHWSKSSNTFTSEQNQLTQWLMDMFNGLQNVQPEPKSGFLRNYIVGGVNSQSAREVWFGDGTGTSALVAAALRLAVLQPRYASRLIRWTKPYRQALTQSLANSNGTDVLAPVVNPYDWYTKNAYTGTSPEGQAFLSMAMAAWRDCINTGICSEIQ